MALLTTDEAVHLLDRAGFGPSPRDVADFTRLTREEAVGRLVDAKPKKGRGRSKKNDDRDLVVFWIKRMLAGPTRLHEKMALFWQDHFATSIQDVGSTAYMAQQNELFRLRGLGPFRSLLLEITRDPAMLEFLDGGQNTRWSRNENYARELMELYALGPEDLGGSPNYTQQDVVQLTRALTGFHTLKSQGVLSWPNHEPGNKLLFWGRSFAHGGALGVLDESGAELPPALNVIDILFTHRDGEGRPTLARFLTRKLWAWFAYPDPPLEVVDELADVFVASGYHLGELMRALLLHDEFWGETARRSTVKTPIEFVLQTLRRLQVQTDCRNLCDPLSTMGMDLFRPPNVAGWSQGLAWLSSGQLLARFKFAQSVVTGTSRKDFLVKTESLVGKVGPASAAELVDRVAAALFLSPPESLRALLLEYVGAGADLADPETLSSKARGVALLLLTHPLFQVH